MEDDWFEQDEYVAERGAYDRTGNMGVLDAILDNAEEFGGVRTQEDTFKKAVNAMCMDLTKQGIVELSKADADNILRSTDRITDYKFKNPLGYILGYVATHGGANFDRTRILKLFKDLPRIDTSGGTTPPDVLRYARFWVLNL
jgi:hypothetical protein